MQDAMPPFRPSGARLAWMGVCAVLAILAFVVLADVRLNEGDNWFGGLSDLGTRKEMTICLLVIEAVAFAVILLLLLVHPRAGPVDDWVSTGGTRMGGDGTRVQIGCPGCGTVFEKPLTDVDEPHEQSFRCPNCGRGGRLNMGLHKGVQMREVTCSRCAHLFTAYREGAECPRCHTPS
jgi:Zn finger protein HypA/HybF involved in hydrogenase expression